MIDNYGDIGVCWRLGADLAAREKAEGGVEQEQPRDDGGLDILAEPPLEEDRSFKHPRDRRPELAQCPAQRMWRRTQHRVGAGFGQSAASLVAGKTAWCCLVDRVF